MARLREGLAGLPAQTVADNRRQTMRRRTLTTASPPDAARKKWPPPSADPGRLARELRAEIGLKAWEENRNPSGAAAAVFEVLGLGAIDILVLLPILMAVGGTIFGIGVAVIAVFFAGGVVLAAGPFTGIGRRTGGRHPGRHRPDVRRGLGRGRADHLHHRPGELRSSGTAASTTGC